MASENAPSIPMAKREKIAVAAMRAEEQATGWVDYYRRVFGPGGILRRELSFEELKLYRQTIDHVELQERLADFRSRDQSKASACEPERMLTVRMPKSMHESFIQEGGECQLSLNQLAITKFLQPTDSRYVPDRSGIRRRGRRPGPQSERGYASDPDPETDHQPRTNDGQTETRGSDP